MHPSPQRLIFTALQTTPHFWFEPNLVSWHLASVRSAHLTSCSRQLLKHFCFQAEQLLRQNSFSTIVLRGKYYVGNLLLGACLLKNSLMRLLRSAAKCKQWRNTFTFSWKGSSKLHAAVVNSFVCSWEPFLNLKKLKSLKTNWKIPI